jgi:hypothetical protein
VYDNILKKGMITARNFCSNTGGVVFIPSWIPSFQPHVFRQPFIFFQILQGTLFSFVGDFLGINCRILKIFLNKVALNEW